MAIQQADKAETLAREFVRILREWLSSDELREIDERNRLDENQNNCHSHDFCDPNQAMIDALESLGEEWDFESEQQMAEINAAWDLVKSRGFAE